MIRLRPDTIVVSSGLLCALLSLQTAWGQSNKTLSPAQATQSTPADAPEDPLGRTTPRGTVTGFLKAAYGEKYDTAAQYLDSRAKANDAALLAKQLFVVIDMRLPAKVGGVSNDPRGSMSDPLDSRRELLGSVVTDTASVDIYLERVDRPNSPSIWLFSRQTLSDIPDVYDDLTSVSVESRVPGFLLKKFLGITLFGWLFLLVILPLIYVILGIANKLLGAALGFALRHWTSRTEAQNPTILPHPIRLLIVAGVIFATLSRVSLSLRLRQAGSTLGTLILIAAFVWAMFLISQTCEVYLKRRMEAQGRLSSTVLLRPARRVMDLIACVTGLMLLLHTLGVNPSATLAGLGVGGIAIALAAQKTLENVIGGASLIMDGAVRVGDSFKIGNVIGTIEVIGLRSTRVRTLDRTIVTIPNGQMATMTLENYSARDQFWLRHLIALGYQTASSTLNSVLATVQSLLDQDSRVLPKTARVRLLRFAESSLEMEVFAYVSARDWSTFLQIQEDLLIRIRDVIESAGVEIAYPARALYLKETIDADGARLQRMLQERDERKEAVKDVKAHQPL
jgi:MscS family membrane protein